MNIRRTATRLPDALTDEEIVFRYGVAASQAAIALSDNRRRRAARLQDELDDLQRILGERRIHHRLGDLMTSSDVGVALWASTHRLLQGDTRGLRTLQRIASGPPGLVRLAAELTVHSWQRGDMVSVHQPV